MSEVMVCVMRFRRLSRLRCFAHNFPQGVLCTVRAGRVRTCFKLAGCKLAGCKLAGCKLAGSKLARCKLVGCKLTGCKLAGWRAGGPLFSAVYCKSAAPKSSLSCRNRWPIVQSAPADP